MIFEVVKLGLFLVGLTVGGGLVFGALKFAEKTPTGGENASTNINAAVFTAPTTVNEYHKLTQKLMEQLDQNSTGTRAYDSLKFVVFVSRHGNRGASSDYAMDPYPLSNTTYWPYGRMELTSYGRLQAYKLGLKIRSLYNGFLPSLWSDSDIYPTSDSTTRVIFSGMLVLAGLYPPVDYQVWSEDLLWQPIILNTDSPDNSNSVMMCQRFKTEQTNAWAAFEEEEASNITTIANTIYNATGTNYTAIELYDVFEKFISEDLENYKLPDWTKEIYPEPLTDLYGKAFVARNSGTDEVSKLYEGEMLAEIIKIWENVIASSTDRLLTFYSGHDSTISNLQIALRVSRSDMVRTVKPGSGLIVELHQYNSTSEYYVQVFYMDGTSNDLEPMTLSLTSCGEPCYYTNFTNVTSNFTLSDFNSECTTTG